jgi:hypothetical protein
VADCVAERNLDEGLASRPPRQRLLALMREPERVTSLEYLLYRDPPQPTSVRMRAAIESLPFENPRLSAVALAA